MKKLHDNSDGFSVVEILLVIIIIILIGFVGWFIYHTDHTTTTTTPTNTTAAKTTTSKSTDKKVSYFTISQWGIRAPYSGNLSLEYTMVSDAGNPYASAEFSSAQLDSSDPQCKSGGDYGGVVTRYASTDTVMDEGGASLGTPAQALASGSFGGLNGGEYAHIGNYYYIFIHPQGVCGTSQASQNIQTQTDDAVKALVQNLQAIPS